MKSIDKSDIMRDNIANDNSADDNNANDNININHFHSVTLDEDKCEGCTNCIKNCSLRLCE